MPVTADDLAVDHELAEICGLLPILYYTTPVNVAEQRAAFLEGSVAEPRFEYRPIADLAEIRDRLSRVDPTKVGDAAVRVLACDKKHELETRLELLARRNTDRFLPTCVEMFGPVERSLVDMANTLLATPAVTPPHRVTVSARDVAAAARAEIEWYRASHPELGAEVFVSAAVTGILVENGDVYIGTDTRIALDRLPLVVNHEVGVHVLTYANGIAQPLHLLAAGLAGYDENQEALAVLAEHLSGGLDRSRLRILALRVVAADVVGQGAGFADTVDRLVELGATPRTAFTTAMRAHRSGGMTKDAVYLRGLLRLWEHVASGASIDLQFVGKITLEDEPLIADLLERGVLQPPALRPRFLDTDLCRSRLAEIRGGATLFDLGGIAA
jgi:uncharacterized protein (TIGR02421 family)